MAWNGCGPRGLRPGETPPLEEVYTYTDVKINNGFTDADFNPESPEMFKD